MTPEQLSEIRALGYAEEAWSNECAAVVTWLRLVAKARDDRADPEWALALSEAADFIERGEHLGCAKTAERARDELAAQAQEIRMGYDAEPAESCAMCCGPVDADGMTIAASGMPLSENNADCSRPEAGSPTAESGDAQEQPLEPKD